LRHCYCPLILANSTKWLASGGLKGQRLWAKHDILT
jgi:hypothetical protein